MMRALPAFVACCTAAALQDIAELRRVTQAAATHISSGWKPAFPGSGRTVDPAKLRSWTDDEAPRYFSGQAVDEKSAAVADALLRSPRPAYKLYVTRLLRAGENRIRVVVGYLAINLQPLPSGLRGPIRLIAG